MRRHPGFSRPSGRPQRRKRVWSTNSTTATLVSNTPQAFDLLGPLKVAGSSVLGATIGPVLINPMVAATGTGTAGTVHSLTLGVLVDNATSTPAELNPLGAGTEYDWMYWDRFQMNENGGHLDRMQGTQRPFETRSKRRIEELNETGWIVVNAIFGGFTAVQLSLAWRCMVTLP